MFVESRWGELVEMVNYEEKSGKERKGMVREIRKKCSLKLRSRDAEEADGGNSHLGQI